MNRTYDRYVNNDLISYISRPQYENSCSFTALTAVFNYLFADILGIKTSNELASAIGITAPKNITGYGNAKVMGFFDKLCRHYGVKGESSYFIRAADVRDFNNNAQVFSKLKTAIKSQDTALIYHTSNHYNLVVGFFEHAENPDDAYNPSASLIRWLIIGEHTEYSIIPSVVQTAGKIFASVIHKTPTYNQVMERASASPIWSRRWKDVRQDLMSCGVHCIMAYSR